MRKPSDPKLVEEMRLLAVEHLSRYARFDLKRFMRWFARQAGDRQRYWLDQGIVKAAQQAREAKKRKQRTVRDRGSELYNDLKRHEAVCLTSDGRYLKGWDDVIAEHERRMGEPR
jgi:hypothetical protein